MLIGLDLSFLGDLLSEGIELFLRNPNNYRGPKCLSSLRRANKDSGLF